MPDFPHAVVVIGATGFLGRNLCAALAGKCESLWAVSESGRPVPMAREMKFADLRAAPALPKESVIINLAAVRHDTQNFERLQSDIYRKNTEIIQHTYHWALTRGITEIRQISSVAVYPASVEVQDDEMPLDYNAPPHPREAFYAWSKRIGEKTAALYKDTYGIHTQIFRPTNPYGPYDSLDPAAAHVVSAFILKAIGPAPALEIKGNPDATRDFIYAGDVAAVLIQSLQTRGLQDFFNLGSGVSTRIGDLALAVKKAAATDKPLHLEPQGGHPVLHRKTKVNKLFAAFPGLRLTNLADGLSETVAWYRKAMTS